LTCVVAACIRKIFETLLDWSLLVGEIEHVCAKLGTAANTEATRASTTRNLLVVTDIVFSTELNPPAGAKGGYLHALANRPMLRSSVVLQIAEDDHGTSC
jgi:hypothetical protein